MFPLYFIRSIRAHFFLISIQNHMFIEYFVCKHFIEHFLDSNRNIRLFRHYIQQALFFLFFFFYLTHDRQSSTSFCMHFLGNILTFTSLIILIKQCFSTYSLTFIDWWALLGSKLFCFVFQIIRWFIQFFALIQIMIHISVHRLIVKIFTLNANHFWSFSI